MYVCFHFISIKNTWSLFFFRQKKIMLELGAKSCLHRLNFQLKDIFCPPTSLQQIGALNFTIHMQITRTEMLTKLTSVQPWV